MPNIATRKLGSSRVTVSTLGFGSAPLGELFEPVGEEQEVLDHEFPLCQQHDVGVVIGAGFASGILATGPTENAYYAYAPATPEILDKTRRIEAVCERHGVPLRAAAMQFPLGHSSVAAIISGALMPGHIESNVETFQHPIPADLWTELKAEGLLHEAAPAP